MEPTDRHSSLVISFRGRALPARIYMLRVVSPSRHLAPVQFGSIQFQFNQAPRFSRSYPGLELTRRRDQLEAALVGSVARWSWRFEPSKRPTARVLSLGLVRLHVPRARRQEQKVAFAHELFFIRRVGSACAFGLESH